MKVKQIKVVTAIAIAVLVAACGDRTTNNNYYTTTVVQAPDAGPSLVACPDSRLAADAGTDTLLTSDAQAPETAHPDTLVANVPDAQPVLAMDTQAADTKILADSQSAEMPKGFKILSVAVLRQDSLGQTAEDVRAFNIAFSNPPSTVWITVNETFLGTSLVWEPAVLKGVTNALLASPGNWAQRLKPDTSYTWSITAASLDGNLSDSISGTFQTSVCFPGQTRTCYTGSAITRNVGRCHDGKESCVLGSTGLKWDSSCVGEVWPSPVGDICANKIDDDCNGLVDDSIKVTPKSSTDTWSISKSSLDGELLLFDVDTSVSGPTFVTWLNIQVEQHGLNAGFYRLNWMNEKGEWVDMSPLLVYYDASNGGYKEGMLDLGRNMYTGINPNFVLGIKWKEGTGMTFRSGTVTHFLLAGDLSPQTYGVGGTVVHSAPRSESSCENAMGKTITVVQ